MPVHFSTELARTAPTRHVSGSIIEHVARWLRPAECHPLAVGAELAARLPLEMQELLGFNQTSEYFGFIAGASPADWLATRP